MGGSHHYAIDAGKLVEKCRSLLSSILDVMETNSSARAFQRRAFHLVTLADALKCVDRLIHTHLLDLLDREMEFLSSINENDVQKRARLHQFFGEHTEFPTLMDTVKTLQCAERVARDYRCDDSRELASVGFDGTTLQSTMMREPTKSSLHRRKPAPQAGVPSFSIDEPVEEYFGDGYFGGEWYFGDEERNDSIKSSMHRRTHSTPVGLPGGGPLLSIDDPIEDETCGESWYFGDGRRSPPPQSSPLQTAGDSSPPQSRHRRNLSTGGIGVPPLSLSPSFPRKHSRSNKYSPSRSEKDSSLFRLIMTLQLCLVRIEEANSVLCEGQARAAMRCVGPSRLSSFQFSSAAGFSDMIQISNSEESEPSHALNDVEKDDKSWKKSQILAVTGVAIGSAFFLSSKHKTIDQEQSKLLKVAGKAATVAATATFLRKRWRILCMNARVESSADVIEDWIFDWICLSNNNRSGNARYQRLHAPKKSVFWYSNGSIRFQLMKRGMDLLYASMGKAIEITRGQDVTTTMPAANSKSSSSSSGLWTIVVASLAASYYNVVGPAAKSASSLATAPSSVIQNAWGMVSLPAVKKASLEATRILKGAAIANRIEICGVSCFVLSREPFPALSSALRRFRRQQGREDVRLGTIHESLSSHSSSVNVRGLQKRDLILHLTGGGFFAHTIAGDLPYLLDWSASSKAVIIIPEYALFPHRYPDAITEVANIYRALRCGQAATLLGFQPDRIIVSGESVGGNLAAALCVSMITDYEEGQCVDLTPRQSAVLVEDYEESPFYEDSEEEDTLMIPGEIGSESRYMGLELPDALMLCCPALNLSLDPTPSRIDGANDPVLPSALISTISASYLGDCSETFPIASPYFASDAIIRNFPPTLIFTSSECPFLDDSVNFVGRLRSVGVKGQLHAVNDLPHAYWALSTAGIPEARLVQKECQRWIAKIFVSK